MQPTLPKSARLLAPPIGPSDTTTELGLAAISPTVGIGPLMQGVTQQIGGALADRYGKARALVVVMLMIALGLALRPLATDLRTMVAGAWAVRTPIAASMTLPVLRSGAGLHPGSQRMRGYCTVPLLRRDRLLGWGNLAVRNA